MLIWRTKDFEGIGATIIDPWQATSIRYDGATLRVLSTESVIERKSGCAPSRRDYFSDKSSRWRVGRNGQAGNIPSFCNRVLQQGQRQQWCCGRPIFPFIFATDICNAPNAMFTGPSAMMQNLPFTQPDCGHMSVKRANRLSDPCGQEVLSEDIAAALRPGLKTPSQTSSRRCRVKLRM